ncbi:restriction endonuclease subunit S, partial [Escherichia coli]
LVLSPKGDSNVKFYEGYINQYLSFANESTGVPQLTAPQVAKYPVVSPCIEEQTAIATILSDMDKEIQTLQQRLDKTRQLKQGMMQELLTGKTRLI